MMTDLIADKSTRLMVAGALIVLLALAAAGVAWWQVHRSPQRVEERYRARRRAAQQLRDDADRTD